MWYILARFNIIPCYVIYRKAPKPHPACVERGMPFIVPRPSFGSWNAAKQCIGTLLLHFASKSMKEAASPCSCGKQNLNASQRQREFAALRIFSEIIGCHWSAATAHRTWLCKADFAKPLVLTALLNQLPCVANAPAASKDWLYLKNANKPFLSRWSTTYLRPGGRYES